MTIPNQGIRLTEATNAYDLLTEIEVLAKQEPKRIHMGIVCLRGADIKRLRKFLPEDGPECNTIGCVAGWTLVKTGNFGDDGYIPNDTTHAQSILGLDNDQARELFYPIDLLPSFNPDADVMNREHAREVIEHIRNFKAKYEVQLKNTRIVVNRSGM